MEEVKLPRRKKEELEVNARKIVKYTILSILLLLIFFGGFYIVRAGERAVVLTFGKPSMEAKTEGLHFKIPLMQKAVKMSVQTQKYEAELTAASKDLQDVKTKIAINYHVVPESVPELYRDIGLNYAEKIIYPMEQEANKATTAQYTAEELITKREDVRERMKQLLIERLRPRNIIVEEISIVNFQFSPSFTSAIENKVTMEQNALAAKNKLEQIKYEAQQKVTSAQAEAEALRLQKQEVTPDLIKLRTIEVQKSMIDKWNGVMPITLLTTGEGSGIFPTLPIGINK